MFSIYEQQTRGHSRKQQLRKPGAEGDDDLPLGEKKPSFSLSDFFYTYNFSMSVCVKTNSYSLS